MTDLHPRLEPPVSTAACHRENDGFVKPQPADADLCHNPSVSTAARSWDDRFLRVVVAADAFTRYPDDMDAYHALCSACERIKDAELDDLRRELGEFGNA